MCVKLFHKHNNAVLKCYFTQRKWTLRVILALYTLSIIILCVVIQKITVKHTRALRALAHEK